LCVPAFPPERIPLDLVPFGHLDPGKKGLWDARLLFVERRALRGIGLGRRLLLRREQIPSVNFLPYTYDDGQTGKHPH
jgi:hypothetical protein